MMGNHNSTRESIPQRNDIEENDTENKNEQQNDAKVTWRSCCVEVDKRVVLFISRLLLTIILMLFCMSQLILQATCEMQTLYTGILMTCMGVWLPSPSYNKNNE